MAQVVALVDDLFFQSKLLETAKQLGVELRTCTTPEAFAAEIAKRRSRSWPWWISTRGAIRSEQSKDCRQTAATFP